MSDQNDQGGSLKSNNEWLGEPAEPFEQRIKDMNKRKLETYNERQEYKVVIQTVG